MIRAIAIVTCLMAALFLIPVQGECSEIPEYEPETEAVCCAVASVGATRDAVERPSEPRMRREIITRSRSIPAVVGILAAMPPARLLHCVLRE